jgi:hypothetical protein
MLVDERMVIEKALTLMARRASVSDQNCSHGRMYTGIGSWNWLRVLPAKPSANDTITAKKEQYSCSEQTAA